MQASLIVPKWNHSKINHSKSNRSNQTPVNLASFDDLLFPSGFVRNVDVGRKCFLILTPESEEDLRKVNVLLKGAVDMPRAAFNRVRIYVLAYWSYKQVWQVKEWASIYQRLGLTKARPYFDYCMMSYTLLHIANGILECFFLEGYQAWGYLKANNTLKHRKGYNSKKISHH